MSQINLHIAIQNWVVLKSKSRVKNRNIPQNHEAEHQKVAEIIGTIKAYYKIGDEIFSKCRKRHIVKPRQIAIYLIHFCTNITLFEIGDLFGGQHHTSILHSVNIVKTLMDSDSEYKEEVHKLKVKVVPMNNTQIAA